MAVVLCSRDDDVSGGGAQTDCTQELSASAIVLSRKEEVTLDLEQSASNRGHLTSHEVERAHTLRPVLGNCRM